MNSKQFKWMAILIGALVVLNLVLVATIWLRDRKPEQQSEIKRPRDARELLIRELKLDQNQVKSFDSLREIHFHEMDQHRREMRELKENFFSGLNDPDNNADSIALAIGNVQSKIEMSTFNHFAALRKICTPGQQKDFDAIIHDVLRSLGPGPGPARRNGPPPHDPPGDLPLE